MTIGDHFPRIFRPAPASAALGAVLIAVGTAVLAFVAGAITLSALNKTLIRSTLDVVVTIVIVVVAVGGLLLIAARLTTRIVVERDEVRVERLGRVTHRFDRRTSRFGSRVVRASNGATSTSSRHLIVEGPGRSDDLTLWRIDEQQFSELVATLAAPSSPGVPGAPAAPAPAAAAATAPAAVNRTFRLDQRPLRKLVTRITVVSLVSLTVLLVVSFAVLDAIAGEEPDFPAVAGLVIPPLVYLVLVAAVLISARARTKRVPAEITVTPSTLTIDGFPFPLASLARIDVTPPTYAIGERVLVLTPGATAPAGSRVLRYSLSGRGLAPAPRAAVFPDYDDFVASLVAASAWRGTDFVRFLLG